MTKIGLVLVLCPILDKYYYCLVETEKNGSIALSIYYSADMIISCETVIPSLEILLLILPGYISGSIRKKSFANPHI